MKKFFKFVGVFLGVVAAFAFVVINFSVRKYFLVCEGETKVDEKSISDRAFVDLSDYRWWVKLWSDRDGDVRVQLDKADLIDYLTHVTKIGDGPLALYQFTDFEGKFKGGLKMANGDFTIRTSERVMFTGKCASDPRSQ